MGLWPDFRAGRSRPVAHPLGRTRSRPGRPECFWSRWATCVAALLLALAGCSEESVEVGSNPPAAEGARSFALATSLAGDVELTWIEGAAQGPFELRAASWRPVERDWSAAETLAKGSNWFVNFADVPHSARLASGERLTVWLERSSTSAHATTASFQLRSPEPPKERLHSGLAQQEFVALAPQADGWTAVWLSGSEGGHDGLGSTRLMAASIARDGVRGEALELDPRVCDCCALALARTSDGALVVAYRDRDEREVRDISVVRLESGAVSAPRKVADDGWRIAGCPVNGPAIAAREGELAVAWFTLGADSHARVAAALSRDGARSFDVPITLSTRETDGLVACAFDAQGTLWVSWLERSARDKAEWMLQRLRAGVPVDAPRALAPSVPGRAAGFAQLAAVPGGVLFVWQESAGPGGSTTLRSRFVASSD
ncbi:MAG: hypothetical protein NTV21_19535 [Planctomycetota bacterium]|nr:hypothetical protein [Planctomycetota bacterium]